MTSTEIFGIGHEGNRLAAERLDDVVQNAI
jgi:hypothetical protein